MDCSQAEVDYTQDAGVAGGQGRTAADVIWSSFLLLGMVLGGCLWVVAGLLITTASVTHSPCAEMAGFSPPRHSATLNLASFPSGRRPAASAKGRLHSFGHLHGVRGFGVSDFQPVGSRRAGAVFFENDERGRAAVACRAHYPEVGGSTPPPAIDELQGSETSATDGGCDRGAPGCEFRGCAARTGA